MIVIDEWLKNFSEKAEQNFSGRIYFLGLQGSYARGEAKDTSDIDIVVIFDEFTPEDLRIDTASVKRAVKTGACNIYHACVHNYLHERDAKILEGLYKSAAFVIQAEYFLRTGKYIRSHSELSSLVIPEESRILNHEFSGLDASSINLFTWAGGIIKNEA